LLLSSAVLVPSAVDGKKLVQILPSPKLTIWLLDVAYR
jgi:hypothetical protein